MRLVPKDSLFGLIVGPIIWSFYFVIVYMVSGVACAAGSDIPEFFGTNIMKLFVILTGVAAVTALIVAIIQAELGRRQKAPDRPHNSDAQRQHFLYGVSLTLNALALVGVFWLMMNPAITTGCQP